VEVEKGNMSRGPLFIEPAVFNELVRTVMGVSNPDRAYYGAMSRLIVSWLANTDPTELAALYAQYGWGGSPNVKAMHDCAKAWLQLHHPDKPKK